MEYLPSGPWVWVFIGVLVILIIGSLIFGACAGIQWLTPDPLRSPFSDDVSATAIEPWPTVTYTAWTVNPKEMHCIVIDGALRQKFCVQEIRGDAFLIGVFQHGDDGEGQGHAFFKGWATRLSSDRLIHPRDLGQTPPV